MPDQPTNPAPAATPEPKKTRRPRGVINAKYLTEHTLIGQLLTAARDPERTAPLAARGWTDARLGQLETLNASLESAAQRAVGRVTARKLDTQEAETARKRLLAAFHPIRVGAKRTYRGKGNEAGRDAFFVNEPLDVSLERLLFIAGQIALKLTPKPGATAPEVTLDGVVPSDIATLTGTRADYVASEAEQAKTEEARGDALAEADLLFTEARAARIDLQLAADQAFPYTDAANATARSAFQIPEDRPASE